MMRMSLRAERHVIVTRCPCRRNRWATTIYGVLCDAGVTASENLLGMKTSSRYTRHMTAPALLTADDLLRIQLSDKRTELVRGVMVVREPPGFRHGDIVVKIASAITEFVRARSLGVVVSDSGYVLFTDPDTVRGPDVSFVRHDRVPDPLPRGFARFAPDLAVEVLSPDDRPGEMLEKVAEYLTAGTPLVWVIDPDRRQAVVHRADGSISIVDKHDILEGEAVLPGFSLRVSELFDSFSPPGFQET